MESKQLTLHREKTRSTGWDFSNGFASEKKKKKGKSTVKLCSDHRQNFKFQLQRYGWT